MKLYQGFTIVELIVVVVLVGAISIFAIPSYQKSLLKSHEKAGVNNVTIMYAAQKMIKATSGSYVGCLTTAACNAALGLSLATDGFSYQCRGDATTFDCLAKRNTPPQFQLNVSHLSNVPCCNTCDGQCPTIARCQFVMCPGGG